MIDGSHVTGSPITVNVRAAKPDVNRFVASGAGLSKAVAGVEAPIRIRVADRFDNTAEPATFGQTMFGLSLNGTGGAAGVGAKKHGAGAIAEAKGGKKGAAAATPEAGEKGKKGQPGAGATEGMAAGKKGQLNSDSIPYEGAWVGGCYELRYIAKVAGTQELHLWCEGEESTREPLPGSPFSIHVSEGGASAVGSRVQEAEANKQGGGIVAGEHVILRPMVHDRFGNATSAPEGALTAVLDSPGQLGEVLEPPKLRSGIGTYESILEPVKSGDYSVHILLHGEEITGSPVSFKVLAAAPNPQKSYLTRPADAGPTLINQQCEITLITHDKYGNQLEKGGVRVDAKSSGVAAGACTTEDHKDGTYTIRLTAGAPGEVKVNARIDSVEIKMFAVFFVREQENKNAGTEVEEVEAAAPGAADPAGADSGAPAGSSAEESGAPESAEAATEAADGDAGPSGAPAAGKPKKGGKDKAKGKAPAPAPEPVAEAAAEAGVDSVAEATEASAEAETKTKGRRKSTTAAAPLIEGAAADADEASESSTPKKGPKKAKKAKAKAKA